MFEVEFVLSLRCNTFTGLAYASFQSLIGSATMLFSAPLLSLGHYLAVGAKQVLSRQDLFMAA